MEWHKIISKMRDQVELAITVPSFDSDLSVYAQMRTVDFDDRQLWRRQPARGGGFGLVSKARPGLCIARSSTGNGAPLTLVGVDQIVTNDLAVWRDDRVPGDYNAINSLADWEQNIHIDFAHHFGPTPYRLISWEWSRAADNELWKAHSVDMTPPTFAGYTATPWDGGPIADGAFIALRATGFAYINCGVYGGTMPQGLHPLDTWLETVPLAFPDDRPSAPVIDLLVAPKGGGYPFVMQVTTWPRAPHELCSFASSYQKVILRGPGGGFLTVSLESGGANYTFSASQDDALVFLIAPGPGGGSKAVIYHPAYMFKQRYQSGVDIEPMFLERALLCTLILAVIQDPSNYALATVCQGITHSGTFDLYVMTST